MKSGGVRTQHPDYTAMVDVWQMCKDASDGELAVHTAGEKYLPKLEGEKDKAYIKRKKRTPYFNATWRTVSGLKGMLFRNAPVVDVPAAIQPYLADIDMAGTPFDMFAQECAEEVLETGRVGVLVDYPPMPELEGGVTPTVAQAEALGIRPMLLKYNAASVINWKEARINNSMRLTLVVLKESAGTETDEFGHDSEPCYRVLSLTSSGYRQQVFRINAKDEDEQVGPDVYPLMNGKPMMEIPFVFIGPDDLRPDCELPPLLDLVTMNLHHYGVSADYEHGCHFSGLPTPVISGYSAGDDAEPLYIGGPAVITLPDPNASATYMEVMSNFAALRENKQDKKAEMAVLGARMLEERTIGVESDATLRTRSQGEQSQLAAFAQVLGMGLAKTLQFMADWVGAGGVVAVAINREFVPLGMDSAFLTSIVAAWQSGMPGASGQNVYALMQRYEMADPAVTYEEEQERIASSGPRGDSGLLA